MKLLSTTNGIIFALCSGTCARAFAATPPPTLGQHLEPIRQGTLHYFVSESSTTKSADGHEMTASSYQEVCKGEASVPVYDLLEHGGSYTPQQTKCSVQTEDGPMDLALGTQVTLRKQGSTADKTIEPVKALNVSFVLTKKDGPNSEETKYISYNNFQTHTQDLSQRNINMQEQIEIIRATAGDKDVTKSFSIRTEFVDDH
jgi:hypothetical protein